MAQQLYLALLSYLGCRLIKSYDMKNLVAITGNIGAGKTFICGKFSSPKYNIPVYNCDNKANTILNTNDDIRELLKSYIGVDIYVMYEFNPCQYFNKEYFLEYILPNPDKAQLFRDILLPFIFKDLCLWAVDQQHTNHPDYMLVENALLFESGMDRLFDIIIEVTAPEEIRKERVAKRHRISIEQVEPKFKTISANQFDMDTRINLHMRCEHPLTIINDHRANIDDVIEICHERILAIVRNDKFYP